MKKILLLTVNILLTIASNSFAQSTTKFTGTWEGKLDVGVELRIVFHIKENGKGGLVSSADSPDQSAYGLKCDTTTISGNTIRIEMKALGASYSGELMTDSTIDGLFTQRAETALNLKKVDKPTERKRPQTPHPPFPYKSEDIIYNNADKSLQYGATITIPEGTGPFPAAIMITGSGAQNRDEEIMGHRSFAVIADYLTRKGFIILRVDDRGMGKSTGKFSEATSKDFEDDVSNSVDYLLSRPEVDKTKLGLIGHSEGGMIAPMVATKRKDINFIVLLAGPGVKIIDLMGEQSAAILRSEKTDEEAITVYIPLYKEMITETIHAKDTTEALAAVKTTMNNWVNKTDKKLVAALGMDKAPQRDNMVNSLVRTVSSPWFKYFISFDPQPVLEKLECKVLALNGDKDIQVVSKQNLPAIEAALKKSKSPAYLVKEMPGLNHLFQTCIKCTVNEYGDLEETFSPAALQVMGDWLLKNAR